MKSQQPAVKKRQISKFLVSNRKAPCPSKAEELYWFVVALTGDPQFAAQLVVDAGNLKATTHGVFRIHAAVR